MLYYTSLHNHIYTTINHSKQKANKNTSQYIQHIALNMRIKAL